VPNPAVEEALANLERLVQGGHRPTHYVARHVLLTLGGALREQPDACETWVRRARAAGARSGGAWNQAVEHELSIACGEFAQCLDPRFLDLPDYDLEYTRAARGRLDDRLRAARQLGFAPSPKESEVLELADRVLATLAQRRADAAGGPQPPSSRPAESSRPPDRPHDNPRRK
jgi:hypothetical protein